MNRMIRGAARLAGPLALVAAPLVAVSGVVAVAGIAGLVAAGGLVAAAGPAAATAPVNESYALNAVGHFSAQMVGQATYTGGSPVILPNADTSGELLRTGIITDTAGAVSASSRIPALAVGLPGHGALHAAGVSSSCSFNRKTGVVTGHGTVTGGRITRPGHGAVALPASPAPNTRMVIPGVAVILLNRQYTGPAGTLTAEALRVRMLRGHHQKLVFATSVCVKADLAAAAGGSGVAMRLTLGGLGLLLLGGIAYQLTRRRRKMAAPA